MGIYLLMKALINSISINTGIFVITCIIKIKLYLCPFLKYEGSYISHAFKLIK